MRRAFFGLVVVVIGLWCAASTRAVPVPGVDIDMLTADSTLIIVGEVTSVQDLGRTTIRAGARSISASEMTATVRVDRVLKQSPTGPTSSIRFHFARPDEFVGWGAVNPLSYGMFFLVDEHGELNLTSPYQPSLPASPDANVKWGTPIERVTGELGAILESSTASAQQRQSIVYLLSTSNDPSALAVLRPFANVSDVSLRLSVAAALLEHNDISTLQFARDNLLNPNPKITPNLLHNLTYAIFMGVKDERAVPSLTQLLRARNTEARQAAASALMHTDSNSAIKPLLSVLNDPDFKVRYYSIEGLAKITGQDEWQANMEGFKSDESKYLNHWKDWAASNAQ